MVPGAWDTVYPSVHQRVFAAEIQFIQLAGCIQRHGNREPLVSTHNMALEASALLFRDILSLFLLLPQEAAGWPLSEEDAGLDGLLP